MTARSSQGRSGHHTIPALLQYTTQQREWQWRFAAKMEKMTVYELQRFLEQRRPRKAVFLSDNQPWDGSGLPLRLHLSFPVILTALNPNAILLKNGANTLCLNNVINVEKGDGPAGFGTVLNVFCRNYADGADEICYTLILK